MSNDHRIARAATAVDAYLSANGDLRNEPLESIARDLLADLAHYFASHGVDPVAALEMAMIHFESERDGS
jgi:hypothetical protein